jgi:hypothetical protein
MTFLSAAGAATPRDVPDFFDELPPRRDPWGELRSTTYQGASIEQASWRFIMPPSFDAPLLPLRTVVILLLAVVVGAVAGVLSYQVDKSLPGAVLWGGGSAGAATALFHSIVGRS